MLDKIKGLLFTPEVDYVDFSDGLLTFRSRKTLKPETAKVNLRMSFGVVAAHIVLQSFDDDDKVYRAKLLNYEIVLDNLSAERRAELRLPRVMRVTSSDLPGYAGTTEDISVKGARVATTGPLERDSLLDLKIEIDDPEIPPIVVQCEVRWTGRRVDEGYHSGLFFLSLDRNQLRTIERYVEERLALERRLHTLEGA